MEMSLSGGAPCEPDECWWEGLLFACHLKETSSQLPQSGSYLIRQCRGGGRGCSTTSIERNQQSSSRCNKQGGSGLGHHGKMGRNAGQMAMEPVCWGKRE